MDVLEYEPRVDASSSGVSLERIVRMVGHYASPFLVGISVVGVGLATYYGARALQEHLVRSYLFCLFE
ncbi:MAG TPA: hypothetical protein VJK51_00380 [Candidatus Nanoarchaeia archaeon]|nr:hypothetical protein [Candidatus Nanoarchaeia archaeon]